MNAHVIGKLNYLLPLYMHTNKILNDKLHKVLMTAARGAIGNYSFKKSKKYILDKCNWLPINKMIENASIKVLHNILFPKPQILYITYLK